MQDKIIKAVNAEPVRGIAAQFQYRGFTISMSTMFKESPEIAVWSKCHSEEIDRCQSVQDAIKWVDEIHYKKSV